MDFTNDVSLPGYSSYFGTCKQMDIDNMGHVGNMGQENGPLSDLSKNACLNLPLSEQYSYAPYSSLILPDNKKLKPEMSMNQCGNSVDYQASSSLEIPKPMYDNGFHSWAATAHCGLTVYEGKPYIPVNNDLPSCYFPILKYLK